METLKTDKNLRVEEMSEVKVEKERIDGKKPREFYTLSFSNAENPLIGHRTRNFFQRHSPDGTEAYWRGADPASGKALVSSVVRGEILKVPVEPYDIIDGTGTKRTVDNFTVVCFDGESIPEVVRTYGHILSGQVNSIGMYRTDVGNMPTTDEQLRQSKINSANARISDKPNAKISEEDMNDLEANREAHTESKSSKVTASKEPEIV